MNWWDGCYAAGDGCKYCFFYGLHSKRCEQNKVVRANDDEFYDYVRIVRGRSLVQTDVEVNAGDKIVSLVTCQQDFADARLIVTGKLVRLGGIDTPNTSVITS